MSAVALTQEPFNPVRQGPDPRTLRRALGHFATGVTVISAQAPDDGFIGITVSSFNTLSLDPALVLWSLSNQSPNCHAFSCDTPFVINVLDENQSKLARHFATPQEDKYKNVDYELNQDGVPVLDGILAHLECRIEQVLKLGDHHLFVCAVEQCAHLDKDVPLLFFKSKFGKWLEG